MYPFRLHDFAHSLGNIFVFPPNQARSHLYDRDFAPEAAIDLRELQSNITSADDDEMLGQEIDVHHRRVFEKWDVMNPRHLGNRSAPANVDKDLVGLKNFIVDRDRVGRLKTGMAMDDRTILHSSQPFFYALVRAP